MKKFKVTVEGQIYEVTVEEVKENTGNAFAAKTQPTVQTGDKNDPVKTVKSGLPEPQKPVLSGGSGGAAIPAPMPGSILDVSVQPGDTVQEGSLLVILEAMKMENEVTAPQAGTITEVFVKKGDTVNSGDPLVTIG